MTSSRIPYSHAADEHFVSLVDYLRHLVDGHGIEENKQLWRSGRERFDALHAEAHGERPSNVTDGEVDAVMNDWAIYDAYCIHGPGSPDRCGHPDCVGARWTKPSQPRGTEQT